MKSLRSVAHSDRFLLSLVFGLLVSTLSFSGERAPSEKLAAELEDRFPSLSEFAYSYDLGFEKRFKTNSEAQEISAFRYTSDLGTPLQRENNVVPFYFDSYEKTPFSLMGTEEKTWTIKNDHLKRFGLTQVEQWGSFSVRHPKDISQEILFVRHGQYRVGYHADGSPKVGVRFIPVGDSRVEEERIEKNKIMDEFLRKKMNLGEEDKIFAPIYYFHPEFYRASMLNLSKTGLSSDLQQTGGHRLDDGFTHMGAYIGKGQTRNAPFSYHSMAWRLRNDSGTYSYPAYVAQVKYAGADQATFNLNAYIVLRLLNESSRVKFSTLPYEKDYMEAISLKRVADHFRGWIDHEWVRPGDSRPFWRIIKSNKRHDTYCAEHITMVINAALNIEQTLEGYIEFFGTDAENPDSKGGEHFWKKMNEAWNNKIAQENYRYGPEELPELDGSRFTPLWKMPGMIAPVDVVRETDGVSEILPKGETIPQGYAPHIDYPGFSLAWAPQTLTDIVSDFMALYARWDKIGPEGAQAALQGFLKELNERIEFIEDADTQESDEGGRIDAEEFERKYGKIPEWMHALNQNSSDRLKTVLGTVSKLVQKHALAVKQRVSPQLVQQIASAKGISLEQASGFAFILEAQKPVSDRDERTQYDLFKIEVEKGLESVRSEEGLGLSQESFFWYSPPTVLNRIYQGNHRHNLYVNVEILATAVDESDLEETDLEIEDERVPVAEEEVEPESQSSDSPFPFDKPE